MATTIKLKNSVTTTNAPSSLVQGEVAINITDKKVWVGNAATTPIQLLGDGGSASFTSIAFGAGTVSNPSITFTGDTNTGIYSPAADTIAFTEGGVESMRIDSSGNVGIGISSPAYKLDVFSTSNNVIASRASASNIAYLSAVGNAGTVGTSSFDIIQDGSSIAYVYQRANQPMLFATNNTERMRITSSGDVLVGKTEANSSLKGVECRADGLLIAVRDSSTPLVVNRLTNDGTLVSLQQATTEEGSISVSGTTVSYNGGHLSRWSQLPNNQKDDSIVKGTVMSNLDDMCVWEKDGEQLPNEQLNKMKVSDVEGDTNVAGVFVNWTRDEDCNSDDMNVAMTGDMIIRIADGVVVQKGDLLMSAGNGTAKPQGDDIVRSKTVAKVTSNHVTCTYADGSYCVPCVLMAC